MTQIRYAFTPRYFALGKGFSSLRNACLFLAKRDLNDTIRPIADRLAKERVEAQPPEYDPFAEPGDEPLAHHAPTEEQDWHAAYVEFFPLRDCPCCFDGHSFCRSARTGWLQERTESLMAEWKVTNPK
jgi:hypothetical protein